MILSKKCISYFFIFIQLAFAAILIACSYAVAGDVGVSNSATFKVLNTRMISDNGKLQIVTVFNEKPNFRLMILGNQPRLVVDLPKVEFLMPAKTVAMSGMAKELRYGAISTTQARMVFTMKHAFAVERVNVDSLNDNIWQLTIDIKAVPDKDFDKAVEQTRRLEQLRRTNPDKRTDNEQDKISSNIKNEEFTIVIDAGHGGFDTGAIGVSGTEEKDVTLAFAKALQKVLYEKNFKVVLTRDNDTFLRLGERVHLARSNGANLFISIHADSIHLPEIRGATVYTLSDKASDSLAKAVADNENKSDLLDGLPPDEPPEVADILIDLTRRETDGFSSKFADKVISSLNEGQIRVINNPHRYAGFMVLKAPDIPSVLIELGYLSNVDDEKLITDPTWRNNMVHIISDAIEQYAQMRLQRTAP